MTGVSRRLRRIIDPVSHRTVIVPVDDSLLSGPEGRLLDLEAKLTDIASAKPNALLAFPGQFERFAAIVQDIPWICNLTASTTRSHHTRKRQVAQVEEALSLGCDAVAVHVNTTSEYEGEMLTILGQTIGRARQYGVPVVGIMYPRTVTADGRDDNYLGLKREEPAEYAALVAHAVRIAADLGASLIKTQYTGNVDTFRNVITAAAPVPVVIAGGPMLSTRDAITMTHDALEAGAAGISYGRNVFQRPRSSAMIRALQALIHEGASPGDALALAEQAEA